MWQRAGAGDAGVTFAGRAVAVLLTPFLGSRPPNQHWGHRGSAQELWGGADVPSRRVPGHRGCGGVLAPPSPPWRGGRGSQWPGVTRCLLLLQAAARGDVLPAPGPCRPPTRRPSARGRAGASARAGASGRTAASARAASPPAPPGTPCPGTCPFTSRRSGRARTRCWTRPRGLSSGSQVRWHPLLGRAAGPRGGGLTLRWPR